jgi:S-formylglutathione hydrolase FrmB
MAFCTVEFSASCLNKMMSMNLLLPEGPGGPFPVLYLLHGYSDNHTVWCRRTALERYVLKQPRIVVMPDGEHSFYCNDDRPGGLPWEEYMLRDVVGFVDRLLPTLPARAGRALAGLSMGGYGAMMLGLRHPEMFCAVSSHSSSFGFAHKPLQTNHPGIDAHSEFLRSRGDEYDCFALAAKVADDPRRPAIRFDCGADDFLLDTNRAFHAHLEGLSLPHDYAEFPGNHNWAYWDEHVRQTLSFVMKHLARPGEAGGKE